MSSPFEYLWPSDLERIEILRSGEVRWVGLNLPPGATIDDTVHACRIADQMSDRMIYLDMAIRAVKAEHELAELAKAKEPTE